MRQGAIIGLGNVALNGHLPAWQKRDDFKIVAGVDLAPERRTEFRKSCPDGQVFSTFAECKSLGLDFVDVCTPPHLHYELAAAALKENLDVLCEKPLVLSEEHLAALGALARERGKTLFTVHNWKFAPIFLKLKELLETRAVGEVLHCSWFVLRDGPAITTLSDKNNWRLDPKKAGGGILIDHGWHAFYLVLDWLGGKPDAVRAELENRQYEDLPVEDTAKVTLTFPGREGSVQTAEVMLTWASRVRRNSGVVEGSQGRIRIEDDTLYLEKKDGGASSFKFDAPLSRGSHHPDWFGYVIGEFAGEISDGNLRGRNFDIASACLRIIECARAAGKSGREVSFASQ